ncbi:testis-expressed protein 13A [Octodon degus]|uniref:Testis-expressed protein 13A n=1 Tax=Octodon degus TaxID=10160 RepID=A0A6P3FAU1_OCTDE|nr:testis-expressed protein 13A [Octodon degus]
MALKPEDTRTGFRHGTVVDFINEKMSMHAKGPEFYLENLSMSWEEVEDKIKTILEDSEMSSDAQEACTWGSLVLGLRSALRRGHLQGRKVQWLHDFAKLHKSATHALALDVKQLKEQQEVERKETAFQLQLAHAKLAQVQKERDLLRWKLMEAELRALPGPGVEDPDLAAVQEVEILGTGEKQEVAETEANAIAPEAATEELSESFLRLLTVVHQQNYTSGPDREGDLSPSGPDREGDLSPSSPDRQGDIFPSGPDREGNLSPSGPDREGDLSLSGPDREGDLSPPYPEREGDISLSGPDSESDLSPSGPDSEGDLSPSGPDSKGDLSPSGPDREGDLSPSGPDREGDLSPSGPDREGDLSPSGPDREGDLSPSGLDREGDLSPSGPDREGDLSPSGPDREGDLSPSGLDREGDLSPSGPERESDISPVETATLYLSGALKATSTSSPEPLPVQLPASFSYNYSSPFSCFPVASTLSPLTALSSAPIEPQMPPDYSGSDVSFWSTVWAPEADSEEHHKMKRDLELHQQRKHPVFRKPGDWDCPWCKAVNFSRRENCFRCGRAIWLQNP